MSAGPRRNKEMAENADASGYLGWRKQRNDEHDKLSKKMGLRDDLLL